MMGDQAFSAVEVRTLPPTYLRMLTIFDEFSQHIPGVNVQHNESSEGRPVLFVELASDFADNVRDLTVVQFKVRLHCLQ